MQIRSFSRTALAAGIAAVLAAAGAGWALADGGQADGGAAHTFVLTYRGFGPVQSRGAFRPGDGYRVRFEGCYAKQSEEAICGFTLQAGRALALTNIANLSHGARADGGEMRTCCLFVQDRPEGFPIVKAAEKPEGVAALQRALSPGQELGVMLRVPDYRKLGPLGAITFSRGEGDRGVTFPATVQEL